MPRKNQLEESLAENQCTITPKYLKVIRTIGSGGFGKTTLVEDTRTKKNMCEKNLFMVTQKT